MSQVGISRVLEMECGQNIIQILFQQCGKREAECSQHGSVVSSGLSHGSVMLRRCFWGFMLYI